MASGGIGLCAVPQEGDECRRKGSRAVTVSGQVMLYRPCCPAAAPPPGLAVDGTCQPGQCHVLAAIKVS